MKSIGAALNGLGLDLRHLLRSMRASPLFALIAVLTIALGIGITTAVVSIADHVLVRGLPFRDSGRLVMMLERAQSGDLRTPSHPTAADWRRDPGVAQAFEGVSFVRGDGVSLRVGESSGQALSAFIADDFFPLLGARVSHGRLPAAGDYREDAAAVAVMSHRMWRSRFGADPSIVGRTVSVDSVPMTIIGILGNGAEYPMFADLWIPVAHYAHAEVLERRGLHADSRTIARLRPGLDSARAAELTRGIAARLSAEHPQEQAGWMPAMRPLREEIIGDVRPMMLTLVGAAVALLLLVCANVAGLLLARLTARTRELAIRSALGASRGRIIVQLLAESVVLSVAGGAVGVAFASACIGVSKRFAAGRLPRADELAVDYRVLAIAACATLATALLCGLWPAIRATRRRSGDALRASAQGSVGNRSERRLRRALVAAQFAIAVVLLVGAGLLLQSFRRASIVDIGFDPAGIVTVRIQPPNGAYPAAQDVAALYQRLLDAARDVPGVIDAAFINHVPFGSASITTPLSVEGRAAQDSATQVFYRTVSANYLSTMRMSMSTGRWFSDADVQSPGSGFVINEQLARDQWPTSSALGQRITVRRASQARADFGQPLTGTVIGIVRDVRQLGQDVDPAPEVYVPYTLETWPWGNLVIRTRGVETAIPEIRRAVRSVDGRLLPEGAAGDPAVTVMEHAVSGSLEPRRFSMSLISAFAFSALILAAMGMYGVVAHNIALRTREIGVRKALGATDRAIVSVIFRDAFVTIGAGVLLGCIGAWGSARLIRALLFDTSIGDPLAYAATVALLALVALLATWLPARHAMRLEPRIAMRTD